MKPILQPLVLSPLKYTVFTWCLTLPSPFIENFLGKNTGASCHFLLQGIFLTQGSNPHPLHLPALTDRFFNTSAKIVIASFRGQGWGHSWSGAEGALFCTVCPFGSSEHRLVWVQILAVPLTSCMTWSKFLSYILSCRMEI